MKFEMIVSHHIKPTLDNFCVLDQAYNMGYIAKASC